MVSLLSSPARLTDAASLGRFETVLLAHGVLGYRAADASDMDETDRLCAIPLVFGLLPAAALARVDIRIKPHITTHLDALGLKATDQLVSILKRIADQYASTGVDRPSWLARPRKQSLAGVRLNGKLYRRMRQVQSGRCAVCGVDLDTVPDAEEALDHIIPWRIVGDPRDGSNWRLLCSVCNGGKADYVSTVLIPAAWNWIYREGTGPDPSGAPDRATRYVVFAQHGQCSVADCRGTALTQRLFLTTVTDSGLAIADNLRVVCSEHRGTATAVWP